MAAAAHGATIPDDAQRAVDAFLRTLQDGDPASAQAFIHTEKWRNVREVGRPYGRCMLVEHYLTEVEASSEKELKLHVTVDGELTTPHLQHRPLPRDWYVRLTREGDRWLIAHAESGEARLGRELYEATSDGERRALMEAHPDYNPGDPARELATQVWAAGLGGMPPPRVVLDDETKLLFALALVKQGSSTFDWVWVLASYSATPYAPDLHAKASLVRLAEASDDCDAQVLALKELGDGMNQVFKDNTSEDGTVAMRRAVSLVDSVDDPRVPLQALHNLVAFHVNTGRITDAIADAIELSRLSAAHGWREGEAMANMDLADVYAAVGRLDLAAGHEWRAFDLLRIDGRMSWAAMALSNAAALEAKLGHTRRAIALYRRAVEMAETWGTIGDRALTLTQLANVLGKAGQAREANLLFDRSWQLVAGADPTNELGVARAEVRMAEHRYRDVVRMLRETRPANDAFFGELTWRALTLRGQAEMKLGQRAEAIRDFREAVTVIEQRRATLPADLLARERYFTDRVTPYRELSDALLRAGEAAEALATAERSKARLLAEAMAFGHPGALRGDVASQSADAARLQARVASLNRQRVGLRGGTATARSVDADLAKARLDLDRMTTELRWREPPPGPAGAAPLRLDRLPDRTIIEYVSGESVLDIFVVRGRLVRGRRVSVSHAQLARMADEVHAALSEHRLDYRTATARAYRMLMEPVAQWLPASGPLAVVPDGELWRVPFQILAPAGGEPLLAHHDIVYSPSLTMLESGAVKRTGKPRLLALGNPSLPAGRALPPLPDAQREVQQIASIYGSASAYVGNDADEARLKQLAASSGVLHLATHTLMDPQWPWASALLLTPGRGDDGLLEAQEILQLGLHCDLAVLSACRTGEGSVQPGEGVIGLAWAFLAAGSRAAVVSQWSVDSAASAPLMVALHRQYRAGLPADAALRRAQLALRADPRYAHPFFWGSFVVIGRP